MERIDKISLDNSEVWREFEKLAQEQGGMGELFKNQKVQDAAATGVQKGIEDAFNKAEDGKLDKAKIKDMLKGLSDSEICEAFDIVAAEADKRDLLEKDVSGACEAGEEEEPVEVEEEVEEAVEEVEEEPEEEEVKEASSKTKRIFASLEKLANSALEDGNVEAAYLIERTLQKMAQEYQPLDFNDEQFQNYQPGPGPQANHTPGPAPTHTPGPTPSRPSANKPIHYNTKVNGKDVMSLQEMLGIKQDGKLGKATVDAAMQAASQLPNRTRYNPEAVQLYSDYRNWDQEVLRGIMGALSSTI